MDKEIIIKKIKENRGIAIAVAAAIVLVILLLLTTYKQNNEPVPVQGPVEIVGEFACLPHSASAPDQDECTLGIESGGNYYALDVSAITLAVTDLKENEDIEVRGDFVPIEAISSDAWQNYNIAGIIQVDSLIRAR